MKRSWAAVVVTVLAFAAGPAAAQPRRGGDPAQDRREAVKQKIRGLRAATLTDELNLDEKALSRLLPVLSKWDDVTEDLLKKRIDLLRRLETADQIKDAKQIDRLVDEAIANQRAFWDLEDKRLAELRKILTPPQIARLMIVLPAFERRIQNQLRRAISRGAGPARGGARANPNVDPDDDEDDDLGPPPRRR